MGGHFHAKHKPNNINRLEQEMQFQKAVRLTDALDIVSSDNIVVVTPNDGVKPVGDPKQLLEVRNKHGLKKVEYIKADETGRFFIYITDESVSYELKKHENVSANAYNLPTYKQFLNTVPNKHIIFDTELVVVDTAYKQQKATKKYGEKKILSFEVEDEELVLILD